MGIEAGAPPYLLSAHLDNILILIIVYTSIGPMYLPPFAQVLSTVAYLNPESVFSIENSPYQSFCLV